MTPSEVTNASLVIENNDRLPMNDVTNIVIKRGPGRPKGSKNKPKSVVNA